MWLLVVVELGVRRSVGLCLRGSCRLLGGGGRLRVVMLLACWSLLAKMSQVIDGLLVAIVDVVERMDCHM